MNKYLRALVVIPVGFCKTFGLKLFHPRGFKGVQLAQISLRTELTVERGFLRIGTGFKMRDGSKIRVRRGARCVIGKHVSVGSNNFFVCRERIEIGDGSELAPNVLIYDHDHDFRAEGGIKAKQYKTAPVIIGKNVWIGANTVILRGTVIGDNCVIGAGSVVRGNVPSNTVLVQKRENTFVPIEGEQNG